MFYQLISVDADGAKVKLRIEQHDTDKGVDQAESGMRMGERLADSQHAGTTRSPIAEMPATKSGGTARFNYNRTQKY